MNKLQVGDIVVLKTNFDELRYRGDPGINSEMKAMKGQEMTVRAVFPGDSKGQRFLVKENDWTWSIYWFDIHEDPVCDIQESELMQIFV